MNGKDIARSALKTLGELGAEKAQAVHTYTVKKEMAIESDKISLLRTLHTDKVRLRALSRKREAVYGANKVGADDLKAACKETVALMESSPEDPHKDISPRQEAKVFHHGEKEPDFDLMYEKLSGFREEVKKRYPKIIMRDALVAHEYQTACFLNSNGVDVESHVGSYVFWAMFTAKDGTKTSSFNYDMVSKAGLEGEFIDWGLVDQILSQTEKQTELKSVPAKFKGDVVITPLCLADLLSSLLEELQDYKHIAKCSLMKDKLGQKVLSDKFTLRSLPLGDEFAEKKFITDDGFLTRDLTVFDKGVLKSNLLTQYGANKTGQERGANYGVNFKVESGDKPLADIIKSVKKGVLMQRISAGNPASNGDFSGIAKNSFYIEDGELRYPLNETMVSGNILGMFRNIADISKESVRYGHSVLPWVHSTGSTISGK